MVEPYLAPHRLSEAKVAYEATIVEKGNWKLVWENNRECYHCAGNHPVLCRTFPEAPPSSAAGRATRPGDRRRTGRMRAGGPAVAFQHRPGRAVALRPHAAARRRRELHHDGKARGAGRTCRRCRSTTPDRLAAALPLSLDLEPLPRRPRGRPSACCRSAPRRPRSPPMAGPQGRGRRRRLRPRRTSPRSGSRPTTRTAAVVEENQHGILSPAYRPGPYSPMHEGGVIEFVDWYCATMRQALEPAVGLREVA